MIGADGIVRPRDRTGSDVPIVNGENSTPTGVRGVCDSASCGNEWALRRRFLVPTIP